MNKDTTMGSPEKLAVLERVRAICRKLPDVSEQVDSFRHTSFRVADKPLMMGEHSEAPAISIKTLKETQEQLYFDKTPYIGQHGWVTLRKVDAVSWREIEELIVEGYCRSAPKRLVKQVLEQHH